MVFETEDGTECLVSWNLLGGRAADPDRRDVAVRGLARRPGRRDGRTARALTARDALTINLASVTRLAVTT